MISIDVAADDAARRAVCEKLDETLFLEAGAGSGKTSCLVDRFVALVESGVAADHIAAITFTEKAAAELVDRIRLELTKRAETSPVCREALHVLDNAAIGTLHAFAQRILSEHPVEAGLPPRFTVNDEIASQVAFDTRWEQFADDMLDDDEMEMPLRLLFASGGKPKHLRDIAVAFNANWDLVLERIGGPLPDIPAVDVTEILAELSALIAFSDHCTDQDDLLLRHLTGPVADSHNLLRGAASDDDRLRILNDANFGCRRGRRENWPGVDISNAKQRLQNLKETCDALCNGVVEGVLQFIASALADFTARNAEARRQAGALEFHDLLVLARNVLRDKDTGFEVRKSLAQRYRRLLLDEFQDTDPIQIEIAVLIASSDEHASEGDWAQVSTEPGRLFFVGDPKQSIYRFRRADIGMFMKARDELVRSSESLVKNFRTGRPIVNWINSTFSKIIVAEGNSQPAYQLLIPVRDGPEIGPPVAFIGMQHDNIKADGLRQREAEDVAATVRRVMREGWSVGFRRAPDAQDEWRAANWSDIAVLLPARTSLLTLERALETSGIPYRVETSSLVYGTSEVRDLMMVARAVDDPTDSLAVVSALRTPAFGCGDDDLFLWHERYRGRWDHQDRLPDNAPADHPVACGLAWLAEQHRQRRCLSPSQMLERILRERRFFELAVEERRPRDLWRRLRFVLDQCRAWEEAGGVTLRDYLRWVEGQSTEGTRVVETVLPETDDDAVRILTVHGAKGLEFPIAILSGLTTEAGTRRRGVEVRFPPSEGWAVKLSKRMSTSDFEEMKANEEQMDEHERRRLLYVAATRARDHLVISVHRKPRGNRTARTAAELLFDEGRAPGVVKALDISDEPPLSSDSQGPAGSVYGPLPTLSEWQAAHDVALARASQPVATSATRLAAEAAAGRGGDEELEIEVETDPGLAKGIRDIDLPPWQKGRYGSAFGRAVHGVLQTVDLATGVGLSAACAAQAAAEGLLGREEVIEAFAQAALDSDVVRAAAGSRHWREVYVGIPYGEGVFEGYIDLLYEADDGLVVVDYKTDAVRSEAELDAKVERYGVQLRAYADAIGHAVGREVVRAVLVFLRPNGYTARDIDLSQRLG
ncbi:UvrD-helicase domain-containing protein [Mycobacterium bourgelatii]|uniref:DNA 3'-5' helicase n=1 Tax=Mycobacterium bourgelatii TaxID=1273442 RepID=A0A7I9YSE2_MYCBU|nr:UvrD-helicase domain-containing protein [Mycobacterium bourgelatii]MCV6978593.1 UvrD-helicase domain-containing protein [Mycobacterium bourgelatii]GFG91413.1 DNA helicase [Mycobacterium bourgelatii]